MPLSGVVATNEGIGLDLAIRMERDLAPSNCRGSNY
jgi:hypothetical protein